MNDMERFFARVLRGQTTAGLMKQSSRNPRAFRLTRKGMRWWLVLDTFIDMSASGGKRRKRIASK